MYKHDSIYNTQRACLITSLSSREQLGACYLIH